MLFEAPVVKEVDAQKGLPEGWQQHNTPVILRQLVAHWPLVSTARQSLRKFQDYLLGFYNQAPVHLMQAPPEVKGRLFYNDDLSDFNFSRQQADFRDVFAQLLSDPPPQQTLYVGSTVIEQILPGLRTENDLPSWTQDPMRVNLWVGNQTRIAAHYDTPDNLACVVAGKRRFVLFPPEQVGNLYVGPLDFTPAGQAASLVDFHAPDLERFPRFADAIQTAVMAELEPGDALYIPGLWWHHVEGLGTLNGLVNYWWHNEEAYRGMPFDALLHAIMSVRDLPEAQRRGWQALFNHYVFDTDNQAHIPAQRRGILDSIDATMARKIRALLLNQLNR